MIIIRYEAKGIFKIYDNDKFEDALIDIDKGVVEIADTRKRIKPNIINIYNNEIEKLCGFRVKYCYKCKKIKNVNEYSNNQSTNDKLQHICKQCAKNYIILKNNEPNITHEQLFNNYFYRPDGNLINRETGKILNVTYDKNNYPHVYINGKWYYLHRLIYTYFYGEIKKGLEIDHKNGDRKANYISNLQIVTRVENARARYKCNNSTGIIGVSSRITVYGEIRYSVSIGNKGKSNYIGYFHTLQDAVLARYNAERRLWGKNIKDSSAKLWLKNNGLLP